MFNLIHLFQLISGLKEKDLKSPKGNLHFSLHRFLKHNKYKLNSKIFDDINFNTIFLSFRQLAKYSEELD